uniref:Receptor-mediated endocytosis protein 6 n=1 Tax=Meloidogyne incognita TaxID=6306 RepID=A0A914MUC5_MELIC
MVFPLKFFFSSYIARFNLMQVGQLLQSLAILPYEQRFPSYFNEILSHLDKNSMTKVMDTVLQTGSASIETIFPTQIADSKGNEVFRRTTFVASLNEINILQYYLKSSALDEINDAALLKNLKLLLKRLPEQFNEKIKFYMGLPEKEQSQHQQQPISSSTRLRNLADKVQNVASKGHQKLIQTTSVSNFRNSGQQNLTNSLSVNVLVNENENNNNCNLITNNNNNQQQKQQNQNGANSTTNENLNRDVLLFEIPDSYEPIGTTSEEEVLKLNFRLESKKCNGQKKTRFLAATDSVVSDRTNTDVISDDDEEEEEEDDQEVEVEGEDDTSSSSSNGNVEEAEEDVAVLPDNFSDVVPISANVSRRGSPSLSGSKLSGRETPFSNHAEQNNDPSIIENSSSTIPTFSNTLPQQEANNNRRTLPYLPVTVRKQNSEGLEEKFGKFVLPPQIDSTRNRDETISLVSDNWSTDVVASDNEAAMIELRNAVDASSSSISSIQQPQQNSFFPQQNNFAVQQQQNNVLPINKLQQQISLLNSSKQLNNLVTNFSSNLASSSNIVTAPIAVLNPVNALTNLVVSSTTTANVGASSSNEIPNNIDEEEDKLPYFDQNNITTCRAFLDAKRKLRLVLSNTTTLPKSLDLINYKESLNNNDDKQKAAQTNGNDDVGGDSSTRKIADAEVLALQQMLHLFLADSINSRDRKQAAQIREVLRCLSIFDNKGIFLLLKKLKREQRQRLCYTLYLQQSQSTLLQFKYCLEKMNNRFVRNLELTSECLVEMLVRFHLQKEDSYLKQFVTNFQNLHVQDEKVELVSSTLRILCDQLLTDPIWHFATVENLDYARKCMERSLMAQIYVYALFPNADADYYRDEVLSKSIRQLSSLLSVDHPDLAIPKCLHAECPWSSAQAELNIINAYKSPRDKMNCISRCCETIENLIVLSAGRVTSSADDILPILVFVIIKANPHALLSNLQFIDSFYASRMQGSEAYWWTQFNSAVEFLKTLLNKLCNK